MHEENSPTDALPVKKSGSRFAFGCLWFLVISIVISCALGVSPMMIAFDLAGLILPDRMHYQTLRINDDVVIRIEAETFCELTCTHLFQIIDGETILHEGGLHHFGINEKKPEYQLISTLGKDIYAVTLKEKPDTVVLMYEPGSNRIWQGYGIKEDKRTIERLQEHHPDRQFKWAR